MNWERPELAKCDANYLPLTPVSFLRRAAKFFANRIAVIDRERQFTYAEFDRRCRQLASALSKAGIGRGDTVSIICANVPALLEAHYAAPMIGAVLNPINIRLDAATIAFTLDHGEAKLVLADREFHGETAAALAQATTKPIVIDIADPETGDMAQFGNVEYEDFLASGDPDFQADGPADEWDPICLLYTSGTTGNPKGAVYHHRGAYLNALSNAATFGLNHESRYLWTLPMFHCSGWTYTWAVTAAAGTHVCLRRVDPARIFAKIERHRITHMCGAPIVLNMLSWAPQDVRRALPLRTKVMTGGAAPPSAVIANMEQLGFEVLHAYGATESYGPSTTCAFPDDWMTLDKDDRYRAMARQGVPMVAVEDLIVADPDTMQPVPQDGATVGEIMVRGNTIMRGYLKNEEATNETFAGGYYRSGDLAAWHPDGYIEVKDRLKDIIISGGENISSLEIEEVLYRHPAIMEAAVVAKRDAKWGETPCAFVELSPGADALDADEVIDFCRDHIAGYKIPKTIVFGDLPKTSTGKIQKFILRERAQSIT